MVNKLKNLVNKLLCIGSRKKTTKKESIELEAAKKVSENSFHQEEEIVEEIEEETIETSTKNNNQKGKTAWEKVHKDFVKVYTIVTDCGGGHYNCHGDCDVVITKTHQQNWEREKLTYQDAQEWIPFGFEPQNYEEVKEWKKRNFTPQQAKSWIEIGLSEDDAKLATYLRGKNYQPSKDLNLEGLRGEFKVWLESSRQAQEYLDITFPKDQRKKITKLTIYYKKLQGTLDLSDFADLDYLNCSNNKLTSLNLNNCAKLKSISCEINQLTNLILPRDCNNLESLRLSNNSFHQDLSFLQGAVNLKKLDVKNTDISLGLEYLPDSLENFYCSGTKLAKELETYERKNYYHNYINLLQSWKKAYPDLVENAQKVIELTRILANLDSALANGKIENETISKGLDIFQLETEELIRELKKQNQENYEAKMIQSPKS